MTTTINAAMLRALGPEAVALLQPLAEKHGLTITYGGGTYGGVDGTLKIALKVKGAESRAAVDFKTFAHLYELEPTDLGRTITISGTEYRIVGMKPGRSKTPVIAERLSDGKSYLMGEAQVIRALGRSPRAAGMGR